MPVATQYYITNGKTTKDKFSIRSVQYLILRRRRRSWNISLYSSFHDQKLRLSTFSIKFKTSLKAAFQPEAPFQLQIHHNSLHKYLKNSSCALQLLFPFNTGAQFYVFLKRRILRHSTRMTAKKK